jgi:hypothetical protein
MGIFQASPSSLTFDSDDPAGRELIVAANLSASYESG